MQIAGQQITRCLERLYKYTQPQVHACTHVEACMVYLPLVFVLTCNVSMHSGSAMWR